ncbi:uncharacterized protein [Primulina eburnea]|uniref:uncharacterized protein isoform X1 n=1 Tax=Primulina eburnea TaxID=1245227 RepID=UPI003C6CAB29
MGEEFEGQLIITWLCKLLVYGCNYSLTFQTKIIVTLTSSTMTKNELKGNVSVCNHYYHSIQVELPHGGRCPPSSSNRRGGYHGCNGEGIWRIILIKLGMSVLLKFITMVKF